MNLSYKENYWNSPTLKNEYIRFLDSIHNLDLSLWDDSGYWDDDYIPFSYFDGTALVSNVCVYSMDMVVAGKRCRVAQISGVGTLPEYRRKGLSMKLTQKAMDWARPNHDFFFLFADKGAYSFYEKCGFRMVDEFKSTALVSGNVAVPGAVKLDIKRKDHLDKIYQIVSGRVPASDRFGVYNKNLFMFFCLYFLGDNIWYIPEFDILVLYKRDNELITIYDIVGSEIPMFTKIFPYICSESDKTAEFLFMVDKLNIENYDQVRVKDNGTFILGDFPLDNSQFILPFTSHA